MPRQFKRLAHSIYECKYHVVFCPKYRYQILRDEVAEYTQQQVYRLCQQKDKVEVLELNVQLLSYGKVVRERRVKIGVGLSGHLMSL